MLEKELISLAVLFLFVAVGGIIAARVKQPIGIGLLLVGAIIGPNMLNLIKDQSIIELMIDFGAILLLFVIGLEFAISKLLRIGAKSIMFGVLKTGVVFFMTFETFLFLGLGAQLGIIFGIILSFSSTVVIVKILESKGLYNREEMPLLIGVLFVEDIIAVIILTFLSKSAEVGGTLGIFEQIFISMAVLSFTYIIMLKIANPVISWFIKNSSEDLSPFIALGMCAGFSYLAYALGLSPATGAFLAGSVVASCPHVNLFKYSVKPYTETFTSLFFLSMGTMVNFASLRTMLPLTCVLVLLVIVSRFVAVGFMSSLITNFKKEQVIFSSIAMVAVSEFSLLIAKMSMGLNIGFDIVSLTAFMIFITSVIMSFSISHYEKVSIIIDDAQVPKDWTSKPKSLSRYINLLINEVDVENANTKMFKRLFFNVGMSLFSALLVVIGWRRLVMVLSSSDISVVSIYLSHVVGFALTGYLLYVCYINSKKMYNILVVILSNNDSFHLGKSMKILNNLLITLALFLTAVFSPFVLANLPFWVNAVPFVLIGFAVVRLLKTVRIIDNFSRKNAFHECKKSVSFFAKPVEDEQQEA
jgi:monovalent cation:H+ antiporter-2, CPA2 family